MKIRSITYFLHPGWPLDENALNQAADFIQVARPAFEAASYEVQTTRLATVPFPYILSAISTGEAIKLAQDLEMWAKRLGYDYISIGPALPDTPGSYQVIPEVLAATENVFTSALMTTEDGGISLPAVRRCAQVIVRAAPISPDGFANLRFAALANVPAGAPFFPAAYHEGREPVFALATEAADLAAIVTKQADSLGEVRQNLIEVMGDHARSLEEVALDLEKQFNTAYGGIDFSLAPFPEAESSVGTALERLGVPSLGLPGSLGAAAFLADTIDQVQFHRAGFCGLFLPVLEDAVLAARTAEGGLTIQDLLLYSAVCGTGLDTIPLPGDVNKEAIAAVLLDLAALAQRLHKPLTARFMPIPGKKAGQPTNFDFAYFANSRVLTLRAVSLRGPLAGDEVFQLHQRKS
jgi:uncharacterized protein (UPF0210 family)